MVPGRKQFVIVVTDAAQRLALDSSTCVQILREAGHLDTRSFGCCRDLENIPDGLNAAELEKHFGSTVQAPGMGEFFLRLTPTLPEQDL